MSPSSPGAYAISALIHGAVALLILFFSFAANSVVQESPKIFELVAGAGDNYAARVAPALGVPGGVKTAPVTPKPAPPPIQPAPPEAAPSAPAKPVKTPDLVAQLKRTEARREARLEARYQKEQEAERKRLTQEEFQRQQAAAKAAAKVAHVDAEGIREGVIGGSRENTAGGAGGRALTREEGSELDAYFSLLKSRIKENHVPPEGVSDTLEARVEFFLSASGSLSRVRIERSSGNAEFDRSVLEACERTRSIGPRPDARSEMVQMTFKMREDESP
ncbi:MAG TPA: cell envelope integrity protein TolA [Opitutaceae bacterium]|nr:cell envelope integrity protein TolA [Opitutaceae bacterium]